MTDQEPLAAEPETDGQEHDHTPAQADIASAIIDGRPLDFRNQRSPGADGFEATGSVLDAASPDTGGKQGPEVSDPMAGPGTKPEDVPDKFWDADRNAVNVDNLMKSYLALERKLGHVDSGVPADPDGYDLKGEVDVVDPDGEVNRRLHQAGFSNDQAQLVYDMAAEYVVPALRNVANEFGARAAESVLENHFGGAEKWAEAKRQMNTWARANLPEDYETLSHTVPGVLRIHAMMQKDEPDLLPRGSGGHDGVDEAGLRRMMRDPKYWRDQDPGFVAQVRDGFQRLYPD